MSLFVILAILVAVSAFPVTAPVIFPVNIPAIAPVPVIVGEVKVLLINVAVAAFFVASLVLSTFPKPTIVLSIPAIVPVNVLFPAMVWLAVKSTKFCVVEPVPPLAIGKVPL